MFGSEILDVAIGLIVVFLLLSLVATALREAVEAMLRTRALYLEQGIRELLGGDRADAALLEAFYAHPSIAALFPGRYQANARRRRGAGLPSYIPSANFADAVVDLAARGTGAHEYAEHRQGAVSMMQLRLAAGRLPNAFLRRALLVAIDGARGDADRLRANLALWFDSAMDRVSGRYRRHTQGWLFGIGLGMAVLLNVNTITIADHLAGAKAAREALVRRADALATDSAYARRLGDARFRAADLERQRVELRALDLPIGFDRWRAAPASATSTEVFAYWVRQILGVVITALAVMLGAPFWFDSLNRVMVIRSTVKPHEKSREEASADRQAPVAASAAAPAPSPPPPVRAPEGAMGYAPPEHASAGADYVPRQWLEGNPDEGIL